VTCAEPKIYLVVRGAKLLTNHVQGCQASRASLRDSGVRGHKINLGQTAYLTACGPSSLSYLILTVRAKIPAGRHIPPPRRRLVPSLPKSVFRSTITVFPTRPPGSCAGPLPRSVALSRSLSNQASRIRPVGGLRSQRRRLLDRIVVDPRDRIEDERRRRREEQGEDGRK
jgi:hypothetical protein